MNDTDGRSETPKKGAGEFQSKHGILDPRRLMHYMIQEPVSYEYRTQNPKGIHPRALQNGPSGDHHMGHRFDRTAFNHRREYIVLGLNVMRFLRDRGGIASRMEIQRAFRYGCERYTWDTHEKFRRALRQAIYGCRRVAWLGTIYLPEGVRRGQLPGAPCPQCKAWMTPEMICQVRELDYTKYEDATVDVFHRSAYPDPMLVD